MNYAYPAAGKNMAGLCGTLNIINKQTQSEMITLIHAVRGISNLVRRFRSSYTKPLDHAIAVVLQVNHQLLAKKIKIPS